jgi:hypothetical protein
MIFAFYREQRKLFISILYFILALSYNSVAQASLDTVFIDQLKKPFVFDYNYSSYTKSYKAEKLLLTEIQRKFYESHVGYTDPNYSESKPLTSEEVYSRFGNLKITKETWGTGFHLSKYHDCIYYSTQNKSFWDASGGGTDELSENEVETNAETPGPYRISGPKVNGAVFVAAIKKKIEDRNKLINKFINSKNDESEIRQVLAKTIESLINGDRGKFLELLSDKGNVNLNSNWNIVINTSKIGIATDIENPSTKTEEFFLDAKTELFGDILGNYTTYINDFVDQDINEYAKNYAGCTVVTCSDRVNYPFLEWVLRKEDSTYKIVSFIYYLNDGE